MSPQTEATTLAMAGHTLLAHERAGGLLNLRVALHGAPLVALAKKLAQLDGVRVTTGPETADRQRCYVVHCSGFKMVLSAPDGDQAVALVSRTPQAALALMSELGALLEQLMRDPPPEAVEARSGLTRAPETAARSKPLRRGGLQPGKPLARSTGLTRKTPLARTRFSGPPRSAP
jgi:hypothetical protein